ncbi:MAG: hypothetical protein R6V44_11365 [Paracoccaceae bacterium]
MLAETFAALCALADVITFRVLSAAGFAIIFGMMGIINMAHGESVMCGAYVTATMVHAGMDVSFASMVIVHLGLRILVNSRFGNAPVAIRENPQRVELLGYDVRATGSPLRHRLGPRRSRRRAPHGLESVHHADERGTAGRRRADRPSGRSDITATMLGAFLLRIAFRSLTICSEQYALVFMGFLLARHSADAAAGPGGVARAVFPRRTKTAGTAVQFSASIRRSPRMAPQLHQMPSMGRPLPGRTRQGPAACAKSDFPDGSWQPRQDSRCRTRSG